MKKLLLATVAVVLMSANAFADSYAVDVDISYVTAADSGATYVGINNGTIGFQKTIPEASEKEMLAMALTAMTANKKVTLIMTGDYIKSMKIMK